MYLLINILLCCLFIYLLQLYASHLTFQYDSRKLQINKYEYLLELHILHAHTIFQNQMCVIEHWRKKKIYM